MRQYLLEVGAFAEREKDLADVVLQVIVNSNMEKVQKWKGSERIMCEALRVLMADELNEERMEGQREGRIEGQREGQREGQIRAYASLVQDGIIPVETGAEKAGMSVDDFTKEMKKAGYDENFSAAVNISSATTGLSIPPSNVLIVYSLASGGASISALFLAGYLPGILTGIAIMLVAGWVAYRKKYPVGQKVPFRQALKVFAEAIPSLFMLVIVIGGIIAGIFTATEASAIAVLYALVLSFIYRQIKWKDLPEILLLSVKTTAIVLLLVATCTGLSWIMSYENIPQTVSHGLLELSHNPIIILLIINLLLLVVGMFMDMTPAILIFTPIFLPIVTQFGMDPIHFGVMMVVNLSVGLCTPPVGSVLFIGCSVAKVRIENVLKPLVPIFVAMFIVLMLVTYIPQISLWIPHVFGF